MTVERSIEDLLITGLTEPFQAGWMVNVLCSPDEEEFGPELEPTLDEVRVRVAEAVRLLLDRGFVEVGDMNYEDDEPLAFTPWGLDVEQTLRRIDAAWDELGHLPGIFDLFWVRNTATGDAVAQAALDERRG